jgi:Icc-related predicted phosphoesterase
VGTRTDVDISLYYASDVHGSDRCWRKFLNAGRFYNVDALVMGGDLTGKAIVPIEHKPDATYSTTFLGEIRVAATDRELEEMLDAIRMNGMYPWIASAGEIAEERSDPGGNDELFARVIGADLKRWVRLAEDRLSDGAIRAFVMAGNDDPWWVDDILRSATRLTFCDDTIVPVGPYEMLSCSYANRTPWDSPRELDEDALYRRLRSLADQLERPDRAILNLHVPPYDSGLDIAIELDASLKVQTASGQPIPVPVGSTAVRQLIEELQPLVALHGHIHESRGQTQIGRTWAINPGSDYNTGDIHGAIVRLEGTRVMQHQLVAG